MDQNLTVYFQLLNNINDSLEWSSEKRNVRLQASIRKSGSANPVELHFELSSIMPPEYSMEFSQTLFLLSLCKLKRTQKETRGINIALITLPFDN